MNPRQVPTRERPWTGRTSAGVRRLGENRQESSGASNDGRCGDKLLETPWDRETAPGVGHCANLTSSPWSILEVSVDAMGTMNGKGKSP